VLFVLRCAIGRRKGGPEIRFGVHVRNENRERTPLLVRFKTLSSRGDDGEPCMTVRLLDED
jgi:hypothetical protein